MARMRLRIYLGDEDHKLGPGKVRLLEAVAEHGSISAAARSMGMAYRHAWEMIDDLNRCFDEPVLNAAPGGRAGGGAELTGLGRDLIERFHAMEAAAAKAIRKDLDSLDARVAGPRSARRRR